MQVSLEDTMLDIIMVLASSVIVAAIAVLWFRHHAKCEVMAGKHDGANGECAVPGGGQGASPREGSTGNDPRSR
jgi:hypothetical protein